MSMQIVPFRFESYEVRAVLDADGSPWAVAADIASALEYRDAHNLIRMLPDDERGTHAVSTPSGWQNMTLISEPGLYRATFLSKAKKAEHFRRWVTREVLPSIRKTGAYSVRPPEEPAPKAPLTYLEALQRVIELQQQLLERQATPPQPRRALQTSAHPWAEKLRAWSEAHPELQEVTGTTLLSGVLGLESWRVTHPARGKVGIIMRSLGWKRGRRRTPMGPAWVYVRAR